MKRIACLLFYVISFGCFAQDNEVFTEDRFMFLVKEFHPVVKQARLTLEKRKNQVSDARGAFDPELYSLVRNKHFDDKNYYNNHTTGLKIPTWFGLSLDANYQQNSGVFLNPENTVPDQGLWSAGVAANLGKGLFIDKRRASLRQAQNLLSASDAELKEILNSLYFEALSAYYNWVVANNQFRTYQNVLALAQERQMAISTANKAGDKASIDTLEAYIQSQSRYIALQEAALEKQNAALELSNFLWTADQEPLEITEELPAPILMDLKLPSPITTDSIKEWRYKLGELQPKLNQAQYKVENLVIKRRLAAEELKPSLKVKYNFLQGRKVPEINTFNTDNYAWGLEFSYPIFTRSARSGYRIAKINVERGTLALEQLQLEAANKLQSYWNKQSQYYVLGANYRELNQNRKRLLEAENTKFEIGESSLFLLNSRENKYLEAQLKLYESLGKYLISRAELLQHVGKLGVEN